MSTSRRHVPLRTCVICRTRSSKRDLMRVVAAPLGGVAPDPTGKLPGRGTYICSDGNCVQSGLRRGRVEYALRTKLKDEEWAELLLSVEALATESPVAATT